MNKVAVLLCRRPVAVMIRGAPGGRVAVTRALEHKALKDRSLGGIMKSLLSGPFSHREGSGLRGALGEAISWVGMSLLTKPWKERMTYCPYEAAEGYGPTSEYLDMGDDRCHKERRNMHDQWKSAGRHECKTATGGIS